MQELKTMFMSAFNIHVYTAYTLCTVNTTYTVYTTSSSRQVFPTSPLTAVFYTPREKRKIRRALGISHRNTKEGNFVRRVQIIRLGKRENITAEGQLLTERQYNKGGSAKVSRRCSWTLCCTVDGYCCGLVDRHCFFPFCSIAVCTACKS